MLLYLAGVYEVRKELRRSICRRSGLMRKSPKPLFRILLFRKLNDVCRLSDATIAPAGRLLKAPVSLFRRLGVFAVRYKLKKLLCSSFESFRICPFLACSMALLMCSTFRLSAKNKSPEGLISNGLTLYSAGMDINSFIQSSSTYFFAGLSETRRLIYFLPLLTETLSFSASSKKAFVSFLISRVVIIFISTNFS